uniref:Uncharacterized protein n=1 Tax=Rhizophagus irregularis (strain DAOM 181602 / DAOM 197198 / MUCL 43194) TaxID=747089 RepID=U9UIP9_RHIID
MGNIFTTGSLIIANNVWNSRVLGRFWKYMDTKNMHIYWILETFPEHSCHYPVTMKGIIPQFWPAHKFSQILEHNNSAFKLLAYRWSERITLVP